MRERGVVVRRLGPTDCVTTWRAMQDFTAARDAHTPDEIWLTEHSPIYTLGLAGRAQHVLRDNGIPVNIAMDRATYSDIDPCGFPGLAVTDLRALAIDHTVQSAGDALAPIVVREIVR